jgi:hypothetical protein
MLYLCLRILAAGKLFGRFDINPVAKILYMALEDPPGRIRARVDEMIGPDDLASDKLLIGQYPGLDLQDESCIVSLRDQIVAMEVDLVVLDTYQKATPGLDSNSDERQSRVLHRLADLTRELGVAIIVVDHVRKTLGNSRRRHLIMDDIKGTGGKVHNADSFILMQRTGSTIKLQARSKDAESPVGIELEVKPGAAGLDKFSMVSEESAAHRAHSAVTEQLVIEVLVKAGRSSVPEIAKSLNISESTVRRCVVGLAGNGVLQRNGLGRVTTYEIAGRSDDGKTIH